MTGRCKTCRHWWCKDDKDPVYAAFNAPHTQIVELFNDGSWTGRGFFFVCVECWAEAGEEELVMLCRRRWERYWADDQNEFKWGDYCRALVRARADEKVATP